MPRNLLLSTSPVYNVENGTGGGATFVPDTTGLFGNNPIPQSGDRRGSPDDKDDNKDDKGSDNKDNTGDNKSIWDPIDDDTGGSDDKNADNKDDKGNQQTPAEFWENHIKELDLGSVFNEEEIKAKLGEGDLAPLLNGVQNAILKVYKQNLASTGKFVNNALEAFKDDIMQETEGRLGAREFKDKLHEAIPVLKENRDLAPVASVIADQLRKKLKDDGKAIQGTKDFLKSLKDMDPEKLGLPEDHKNEPGGRGFLGGDNSSSKGEVDFLAVLRGN